LRILIPGFDGYIGWPLTINLLSQGHEVVGYDDLSRRKNVYEMGSDSLTDIDDINNRISYLKFIGNFKLLSCADISFNEPFDAVIYLAQQPSAAWSMRSMIDATMTQYKNIIDHLELIHKIKKYCPNAHIIKLGSMGEYGTPDCHIPEGVVPSKCISGYDETCQMQGLLFPRTGISFYHISKICDTYNLEFACRTWGLTATDIMQGIVYGVSTPDTERDPGDPNLLTRFDYDECFGTVINRFATQAIANEPITLYGAGTQAKSFLPLRDSIQAINLILNNPPEKGSYRTINQLSTVHHLSHLAKLIKDFANSDSTITNIPNPRTEIEDAPYHTTNKTLTDLGYQPSDPMVEINRLINDIKPFASRIKKEVLTPKIKWKS